MAQEDTHDVEGQEKDTPASGVLNVAQVAEMLSVDKKTVRRWLNNGDLEGSKVGPRVWVIPRRAVEEKLGKKPAAAPTATPGAGHVTSFVDRVRVPSDR